MNILHSKSFYHKKHILIRFSISLISNTERRTPHLWFQIFWVFIPSCQSVGGENRERSKYDWPPTVHWATNRSRHFASHQYLRTILNKIKSIHDEISQTGFWIPSSNKYFTSQFIREHRLRWLLIFYDDSDSGGENTIQILGSYRWDLYCRKQSCTELSADAAYI